ncbi:MAG: MocR-like pyridoxine biosynthesis transcription factor PdxR [Solirubrobacteraceae bacterium]
MALKSGPVTDVRASPELLVTLRRGAELPLHEQLERALREQIRGGRLSAGERLPSTRALSQALDVSRGVVTEAYGQLAAEGYLSTRQGAPVRVASAVRTGLSRPPARSLLPAHRYEMRPFCPNLAAFPREAWLRCLRAALRESPLRAIDYGDPRGAPELREELAAYLGRARGAVAEPERMVVCTGFTQGLSLLCRTLAAQGVAAVALEDPGCHAHRLVVEQSGLRVVPVPVDEEGVDVRALQETSASVALVTPAHQFPSGALLSPARRAALIEWAEECDGLIVENDYDGELRFDRGAVGALQGLAPERVLYAGSASKRLAPALRLGWLLVPAWLCFHLMSAKAVEDAGSEAVGQLAFADFLARGELDRHMRRMRPIYERRRRALLSSLQTRLPRLRASGAPAGIFEPVTLPPGIEEHALLAGAAQRGVGVEGLELHSFATPARPGLVLGYGALPEPAIDRAVALLAEAVAEL